MSDDEGDKSEAEDEVLEQGDDFGADPEEPAAEGEEGEEHGEEEATSRVNELFGVAPKSEPEAAAQAAGASAEQQPRPAATKRTTRYLTK